MIVGLGNPGREYERTRHNVGFRASDLVAQALHTKIDRLKFQALTRAVDYGDLRILLVQPQTYMNLSGAAVSALASYYKIPPERILVIFDDVSLPLGPHSYPGRGLRRRSQRHQVHHPEPGDRQVPPHQDRRGREAPSGLRSGRLGPEQVLPREEELLAPALQHAADAALMLLDQGIQKASSAYNGK